MRRGLAATLVCALVVAVAGSWTYRFVVEPEQLQRRMFGQSITSVWDIPNIAYKQGLGPWNRSWTYSMDPAASPLLRDDYGCRSTGSRISCRRCIPPKYANMCILNSVALTGHEYVIARIIDGKYRVERGVSD